MGKENVKYIYTYTHTHTRMRICNGILFRHKKEILPFATTWMNLEYIILSETRQTEKHSHDLTYTWHLKLLNTLNPRVQRWLAVGEGWRKWGDTG